MAEEIKGLIEKIQQEGVKVAEEKALQIETQARQKAEEMFQKAKNEAEKILKEAQGKIQKLEQASKTTLTQAGRNLIINLRKEINSVLEKIMVLAIRQTLKPQELTKIISALISDTAKEEKGKIVISLSKEDLEGLEKGFLSQLQEEIKKGLTLKAQEEILGGFSISYDAGKSQFDFSDKALAEYIGQYLKPELAKLLKE